MTRAERRERRRQMAQRVRAGRPVDLVAQEFGVSSQTVQNACLENQVALPAKRRAGTIYRVLAALQGHPDWPLGRVARELGVKYQRVAVIYGLARWAGLKIPTRRRSKPRKKQD